MGTLFRLLIGFEYQPIALEILTQPNRYTRLEINLLADEKQKLGSCLGNTYTFTYTFISKIYLYLKESHTSTF